MNECSQTDELLSAYAGYLKSLNRVAKTVKAHVSRIKRFLAFAETRGVRELTGITQPLILEYQSCLAGQINNRGTPNSAMVQNQHLTVLVGFFGYLKQSGHLAHNPAGEITYAKVPQRLPKAVLTHQEMRRLLRQPDVNTVLGFRDRTMLELLYSAGLRRQELLNLDIRDVDLEGGLALVRQGKGGKDRVVPVGRVACKCLESYLGGVRQEIVRRCPDPTTQALFPSVKTGRLHRNALADLVARYARQAGIEKGVSPHTFRHTCATQLVKNRAGIRHVQEMLGHARLSSTQEYIRLTITDLKEAHSKYHPREKDHKNGIV